MLDEKLLAKSADTKILKLIYNSNGCEALVQGKQIYTVSFDGAWRCSCPGFLFNKKCKHIERVKAELFLEGVVYYEE